MSMYPRGYFLIEKEGSGIYPKSPSSPIRETYKRIYMVHSYNQNLVFLYEYIQNLNKWICDGSSGVACYTETIDNFYEPIKDNSLFSNTKDRSY